MQCVRQGREESAPGENPVSGLSFQERVHVTGGGRATINPVRPRLEHVVLCSGAARADILFFFFPWGFLMRRI